MDLYFKESIRLLFKTWPFWILKIVVYLAIAIPFFIIAALFLWLALKYGGIITIIIIIFGLMALWGYAKIVRRYVLYLIKAGHLAVLGELIYREKLPEGKGMIGYGFEKVKSTFVTTSVFWVIDEIINAVVHGVMNVIERIGRWIPVQAVQNIFKIIARIVGVFLSYIDEAVLSYIFVYPKKDPWKGARDGLVLYFKCWKQLLATSAIIVLLNVVLSVVLFYVVFLLTLPLAAMLPFGLSDVPFLIALAVTGWVKVAFFNQFTLVWMVVAYHKSIQGVSVDSKIVSELENLVPKFKEITSKAGKN